MEWEGVKSAFLAQCANDSKHTLANYGGIIKRFLAKHDPASASPAVVWGFCCRAGRGDGLPAPATIRSRLYAVKRFYRWAQRLGVRDDNPAQQLEAPTIKRRRPVQALTREEWDALIDCLDPDDPELSDQRVVLARARTRAWVITASLTGLRRSEIQGMNGSTVTWNADLKCWLCDLGTKGGKRRRLQLPDPARVAIEDMLEREGRSLRGLKPGEAIWSAGDYATYDVMKRAAKRAGVEVWPHKLRTSAATWRSRMGHQLELISSWLGHSSIDLTRSTYIEPLGQEEDDSWRDLAKFLGVE